MASNRALYIHIGVHKTASTHLQYALRDNADLLAEHNVLALLPPALRPDFGIALVEAISAASIESQHTLKFAEIFSRGPIGSKNPLITVLSEENISGRLWKVGKTLYPNAAKRLQAIIKATPQYSSHTCLVVIRSPATYFVSAYLEFIKSTMYVTFDEYIGELNITSFKWSEILKSILENTDIDELIVVPFENYQTLCRRMLQTITGVRGDLFTIDPIEKVNSNVSQRALKIVERSTDLMTPREAAKVLKSLKKLLPKKEDELPFDFWGNEVDIHTLNTNYDKDLNLIARLNRTTLIT